MIRMASSGELFRFRELTTLQQWIVERKVTRDDEISRSGDQWKRLGGIAELASFFHIVEQAAAVARADGPRAAAEAANAAYQRRGVGSEDDPALVTTAQMGRDRQGPTSMGNPLDTDDPAFARTNPTPKLTPAAGIASVPDDTLLDDDFVPPRRRSGLWAGLFATLVVLGAGGYLAAFKRDALRDLFAHTDKRAEEAVRQGREYFLLDSDDAFRSAVTSFERGRAADEKSALPLAGLAEVRTTWASYLRDDARALESGGATVTAAQAAKTLRREAQVQLDEAKRYASEALNLASEAPEVNRAMADYLRVDGAPAAEVERYLARVAAKKPQDPESAYVAGALALRDGNLPLAKTKLAEANQLNQAATQHAILRASVMLARIEAQTGDKLAARTELQTVLAANAQHDRARALLATLESDTATPPSGAPVGPTVAANPSGQPATPPTGTAPAATQPSGASDKAGSDEAAGDYKKLVAQADRLSENGHAKEARKLYDRALAQRPNGLEAIMGLGYCDLDGEKFSAAVDHFKRALSLSPGYGDAMIGLAEAYKLRGDRREALNWYRQYLLAQPIGPKATMAKNNIRDLEPKVADEAKPEEKRPEPKPVEDKRLDEPKPVAPSDAPPPSPPPSKAADDAPKKADEEKPVQLPRPPTNDEPPP
ncbi:MAG: Proline-rich protein [Myxococcales bacterium]|nr:Proline-rich protein [Myxococcales bacterium]